MTPPCHNRPAFKDGEWMQVSNHVGAKPRYRWVPRWFEQRCATHDGRGIGPSGESYPKAHNFDCGGCRWELK